MHGIQRLSLLLPKLYDKTIAGFGLEVFADLLWYFVCAVAGIFIRKYQSTGKGLWSGSGGSHSLCPLVTTDHCQIWCWIDIEWDFLRVAFLYGIIW